MDPIFDDDQIYALLLKACKQHAVNPSSSLESEKFFRELLLKYNEELDPAKISSWLEKNIANLFIVFGGKPKWLQDAEWPFANSQPMIFAGQIDWLVQENEIASRIFHDDTSFYLFIGQKVESVVVMQQK